MARELQEQVLQVLEKALGRRVTRAPRPEWLSRPGRHECLTEWPRMRRVYRDLTDGMELPGTMPPKEWRELDGQFGGRGVPLRLVEIDEKQHFNEFRAKTLRLYPKQTRLGFPKDLWLTQSELRVARNGGGWGKPVPPLFPMAGGRHRQRAFRDALADLLPPLYGYAPTLRIASFEVEPWIWQRGAAARLKEMIAPRLVNDCTSEAPSAPTGLWELCEIEDVTMDVPTALIDVTGIPASFGNNTYYLDHPENWDFHGPVTLHWELNWLLPDGQWQRAYRGFNSGRHRVLLARRVGRPMLASAVVTGFGFMPSGARPSDRVDLKAGTETPASTVPGG